MYEIFNKLSQPLPVNIGNETIILPSNKSVKVEKINDQIINLVSKNYLKIKEIKQ